MTFHNLLIMLCLSMGSLHFAHAIDGPAQSMTPETQHYLAKNNYCSQALSQVAKVKFDWQNAATLPVVRVGLSPDDLLIALHKGGMGDAEVEKVYSAFGEVIKDANQSPVLMDTVRAILSKEIPHDRVKLIYCMGLTCQLPNKAEESVHFPFNYILTPMNKVAGTNVNQYLPQLPSGPPHPNGGMSRVEIILLDKIDIANPDKFEGWLAKFFKDATNYASHSLLSEWIAKNNLLSRAGQSVDPLFRQYINIVGNVIFIDPQLYYTFLVSRKFDAQLAVEQIRIDSNPSLSETEKNRQKRIRAAAINKLSLAEISAKAGDEAIRAFQLTADNVLEIGRKLGQQFAAFNDRLQVQSFREGD
jgi:hypothetical protein